MPYSEPTATLLKRGEAHEQIITWNLSRDAPGSSQVATLAQEGEILIDAVIRELEGYIKDDTFVQSVAMSADIVTVVIDDDRGIFGSETLEQMVFDEKQGSVTYKGKDREILDEYCKNPEASKRTNSGEGQQPTGSPEHPPSTYSDQMKAYIATYNVSSGAPGPQCRGVDCKSPYDLKGFVQELRRVKDTGVIVSAMFNGDTAVITVDAPKGL